MARNGKPIKARMKLTFNTIHALAWDAANRSMREAGRDIWSEDDYNVAVVEFNRLVKLAGLLPEEAA